MNKIIKQRLLDFFSNLVSCVSGGLLIFFTLISIYQIIGWLGISLPKNSIFLSLLKINFLNVLNISLMIAALELMVFFLVLGLLSLLAPLKIKGFPQSSNKLNDVLKNTNNVLISSLIPLISIFSFSDSQLSSFINLSALFAIFLFIFRFKRE